MCILVIGNLCGKDIKNWVKINLQNPIVVRHDKTNFPLLWGLYLGLRAFLRNKNLPSWF